MGALTSPNVPYQVKRLVPGGMLQIDDYCSWNQEVKKKQNEVVCEKFHRAI